MSSLVSADANFSPGDIGRSLAARVMGATATIYGGTLTVDWGDVRPPHNASLKMSVSAALADATFRNSETPVSDLVMQIIDDPISFAASDYDLEIFEHFGVKSGPLHPEIIVFLMENIANPLLVMRHQLMQGTRS